MYGSSEDQELRALYQFGQPDSSTNLRTTEPEPTPTLNNQGGGNNGNGVGQDTYSPREEPYDGMPSSPGAFATPNDTYVPTGNGNMGSNTGASFVAADEKRHHKEGEKKNILKKALGMDKKSTKGMTDEEKKAFQLQERWKNAMLEEQRLNELETRVAQQETLTGELGQAPNFPPKFLCIRPLVFHKIAAVPQARRLFVTMAFWDWVAVCIILVANCPITIACNYAPWLPKWDKDRSDDIKHGLNLVLACVYLVGIPLSFFIWYWPIYQGNFKQYPNQHVLAMSGLIIALAQAIFAFVGPCSYGFCGVLSSKWVGKTRKSGVVAPMAIVTALWGAQAIFTCYMIVQEFIYYRKDLAVRRALRRQQAVPGQ
ncbi:SCAMP family [Lotmaria passim]